VQLAGLGALALAVYAAAQTQSPQATRWLGEHMALCLSGGATPEGASFLGHCAACWAAVALSLAGAVMLALPRGDRRA
jgi:hypothetical protein